MSGYFLAPRYAFGPGAVEQLASLSAERPALLVASRLAGHPRVRRIEEELGKRSAPVRPLVVPAGAPSTGAADALAQGLRERNPDTLVAVGGGRTLDIARAAWVRWARPEQPLAAVNPLTDLRLRERAGFVAVPSTAGSGAEASGTLQLLDPAGESLRPSSRELVPDWALLDPYLPTAAPPGVRADAAAIALAHALEALVSSWVDPFSEALARRAFGSLARLLPKVVHDPTDVELSDEVLRAAAMAGLAAGNAQDGAAAALADALAPVGSLSYGRRLGVVLPYVLELNYPSARDAYQSLAGELGSPIAHRSDLARSVRAILATLGVPWTLRDAGLSEPEFTAALPRVVERASRSPMALSNPRVPSPAEWEALARAAYRGEAVGF